MANISLQSLTEHGIVGFVVFMQAILLGLCVIGTTVFLIARNIWLRHKASKRDEYERILIDILFDQAQDSPGARSLPNIWLWQERIFRDVILHQIRILSGDERTALVKLYVRSGYLTEDYRQLRSRAWWVRLRALIRIDLLCLNECRDSLLNAMNDQNVLVALCATRAMSRLTTDIDTAAVITTLERVGARRQEAAVEVLSNIGTISGTGRIIEYLEHKPESPIALACVRVLGDLRAVDASAVFLQILATPEVFEPELIAEVLTSMRKIADPAALDLARQTLAHPSALVRATSVRFVQDFGETFTSEELSRLQADSSVEVRRALTKISDSGEAA